MNSKQPTIKELQEEIRAILFRQFATLPENATKEQMYKAVAITVRNRLTENRSAMKHEVNGKGKKRVYYMCMEFLLGRSLKNSICNLGLVDKYQKALKPFGYTTEQLYECEPDAGLGNGGLGRLAACFMDSLATLGYPATGFSICYEYGLFKQKIVDGTQLEMPDVWLPGGEVWLVPRTDKTYKVRFGGQVTEEWQEDHLGIKYENYEEIEAVPYDMMVSGSNPDSATRLRLWKARNITQFNMNLFTQGQYAKALEESNNAEIISKVLYPSDNHTEGKLLRLAQQYFLVSASCQSIIHDHLSVYGTLDNFADKVAIHINDTHPALCIPELMRLFMDEYNMSWEKAWDIVSRTVSYTNHTVMPEALEVWNEDLFKFKLPRMHQIIKEINNRFSAAAWEAFPGNWDAVSRMSILAYNQVRMANLAIVGSHHINGVSKLHSEILKENTFRDFYKMYPDRFDNVTNGVAHRRWLCYSNPGLAGLLDECIGKGYRKKSEELAKFKAFENDDAVLERLRAIKHENKIRFANELHQKTGILLDTHSVFDVQIKRLHEYKRQLLNALHIIGLYLDLKDNPDLDIQPQTFLFGAKAAPGYATAKEIIKLIYSIGADIEKNPKIKEKLSVVFLEDYNVSLAEALVPCAEISEQISLAGKEASGTGCMKLMLNGALTIGTLDGANVEMYDAVGEGNMYIFGRNSAEVESLWAGGYHSEDFLRDNQYLTRIVDYLRVGFNGESFAHIASYLTGSGGNIGDPFMCLADFESYRKTRKTMMDDYQDRRLWTQMSLRNIAAAGYFSADRSIEEYAQRIWKLEKVNPAPKTQKKQ